MNRLTVNDSAIASLPGDLQKLIASCPQGGAGVHQWLFRCARRLHRFLPDEKIISILEEAVSGCGREVREREITDAVRNSVANGVRHSGVNPWPQPSAEQIEATVRGGMRVADLWEASPVRFEDKADTEYIISTLFPGDPLLCCGWSNTQCLTKRREAWSNQLGQMQFIVPSPMTSPLGHRKEDGQLSPRTLDNTGPRRFLVIECDFSEASPLGPMVKQFRERGVSTADMCASVLWSLQKYGPLVMVVHSGGKSLHGWFYCQDVPEVHLLRFMRMAVFLGADRATWSRCQLVRMPEGVRPTGPEGFPVRQPVLYFDPKGEIK